MDSELLLQLLELSEESFDQTGQVILDQLERSKRENDYALMEQAMARRLHWMVASEIREENWKTAQGKESR